MPTAAILSVTAEDLTVLLLGEKWRAAGLLLSIIALRGIFQVVERLTGLAAPFHRESGPLAKLGNALRPLSRSWQFSEVYRLVPQGSPWRWS